MLYNKVLQQQLAAYFDDKGVPGDMAAMFESISRIYDELDAERERRRLAEYEGEQQRMQLEASQRIAKIGSWELDLTGPDILTNKVRWSDELSRMLGYVPGAVEMNSSNFFPRIYPEDRDRLINTLKQCISDGTVYQMEHTLIRPDGSLLPVYARAVVIYDEHTRKPLRVVGTLQDVSERKKSNEELQKAHSELKLLFDNIEEVFFSVDMEYGRVLQMSHTCEHVYGYTADEFKANPKLWLEVVLPEDMHIIHRNEADMYAGRAFTQEYRIRNKDGSTRWIEGRLAPTLDGNGKLIRLDGTVADITKRKEAEIALRNSEVKFRYLISNCTDAIMIRNEDNTIVYCSDSVYNVIGYKPEEVIGRKTLDDIHPDDMQMVLSHRDKVLQSPAKPVKLVYRRQRKDGVYIWCEGTSTNMLHQPEVRGIVVNFRDITEMKEVELALKASENKFRHMISHSSDVIMVMDRDKKVTYVSDSIKQVTGFMPGEVLGGRTLNVVHPEDLPLMMQHWDIIEKNPGKAVRVTYRRLNKEGDYIWCEGTGINLYDNPEINGLLINFRDITDQKNYEDALRESNEELKKSNSELDRFVYSVSHDLRAPLTSMLGIINLAADEVKDEDIHTYLDMLRGSIRKLDGFIHDILDYSRNARLEVGTQEINFRELLADITNNLKFMNPNVPVKIDTQVDETVPYISDASRVSVILNNLISNAIRYYNAHVAEPFVNVVIKPEGRYILLSVSDNGIGIEPAQHGKIFEMFYRVSQRSLGSGLGLYIVKETVEKLGGMIHMESTPLKGTLFEVRIPNLQ